MDQLDRLILFAEMEHEVCGLNHGREEDEVIHKAHDYLVIPVGIQSKNKESDDSTDKELVIPVCLECIKALKGDDWTLLYCFDCGESRWVFRELAKNNYRHHILWLRGCPDCSNEFGGLYFTDQPESEEHQLLSTQKIREAA